MKGFLAAMSAVSLLVAVPAAGAEVTQSQSVDTISVVGIGRVPISPTANPVEANDAYHQALVQAVGDGLFKARMLATAGGGRVGPLEAISENGRRSIECKNGAGESSGSYKGAEPDSGTASAPTIAVEPAAPPRPVVVTVTKKGKGKSKAHRRIQRSKHGPIARRAENGPFACEISSELQLVYALEVHG
jgi:hypothetical protein